MKMLSLELEVSVFLQTFTWRSPSDEASFARRLELIITLCECLKTCEDPYALRKGAV
jgi:hypothetical protein